MENNIYDLSGIWKADIGDGKSYSIQLPGTLDENKIGHQDVGKNQWHPDGELGKAQGTFDENAPIVTRFTRNYTFEGEACFSKEVSLTLPEDKRVFLEVERTRCMQVYLNGVQLPAFNEPTLSTPQIYEVTGLLKKKDIFELRVDNSYPGLPGKAIMDSSAATDETQTNWNGVLGYLRLRLEEDVFIKEIRIYPTEDSITVKADISASKPWKGCITLSSEALESTVEFQIEVPEGNTEIVIPDLLLADHIHRWDEYEGSLYELTAGLAGYGQKTVAFGIRTFVDNNGRLTLNGRTIFLRSEANCAEFPESGHVPMTVDEWMNVLFKYKSYGINCMRFHSHCPPEAAFVAADSIGMLMQPELSHWDPKTAFQSQQSILYYRKELKQILYSYANHPSFVMLTLGNELKTNKTGHERMNELLDLAHQIDSTRLFANGSNVHYGEIGCDEKSDFYASQKYYDYCIRGTYDGMDGYINHQYPNEKTNYDETMHEIRKMYHKPVFSFEVGQYEVLPDFDEINKFHGISSPDNLRIIKDRAEEKGFMSDWKKYVEATGEISKIGYREEIESAMRTQELSGISLLGLQDFPGQGTALVGMMDSHLDVKPYPFANPESFASFFRDQLPLVYLEKYTYENTEMIRAEVKVANYGKKKLHGPVRYELYETEIATDTVENFAVKGSLTVEDFPIGKLTSAGWIELPLTVINKPTKLGLKVTVEDVSNIYPVWVYPCVKPICPENVYETEYWNDSVEEVLQNGGTVYLTPPSTKEALPVSIQAQFTTDFWSVGTFPKQEGGMGQLIDNNHPLFHTFPTEFHTNWQWWPMAVERAAILPDNYKSIITEMDSYATLRHMTQLLECKCGNGKLLFSTLGLQNLQQYPECRALLNSIYHYLNSEEFNPTQMIKADVFKGLVLKTKEA